MPSSSLSFSDNVVTKGLASTAPSEKDRIPARAFSMTKSGGTVPLSRSSNTRDLTSPITRAKASRREM